MQPRHDLMKRYHSRQKTFTLMMCTPMQQLLVKVLKHAQTEATDGYFFFSRNGGRKAKLSQTAVQKALRKYAAIAHETCNDVPLDLHAHQFRHARASHWLDEGINIVQISHLLGHESLEVTMRYLDISIEMEAKALLAIQSEEDRATMPKWKNADGTLKAACGL